MFNCQIIIKAIRCLADPWTHHVYSDSFWIRLVLTNPVESAGLCDILCRFIGRCEYNCSKTSAIIDNRNHTFWHKTAKFDKWSKPLCQNWEISKILFTQDLASEIGVIGHRVEVTVPPGYEYPFWGFSNEYILHIKDFPYFSPNCGHFSKIAL